MRRGRRVAKWAGLVGCVVLAAVWTVTVLVEFSVRRGSGISGPSPSTQPARRTSTRRHLLGIQDGQIVAIDALFVLAVPTAWLFWRDRLRVQPRFCRCGYDITGNASSV